MAEEYRHKIIIDPVHGDIGLSEIETHLIDSRYISAVTKIEAVRFRLNGLPQCDLQSLPCTH